MWTLPALPVYLTSIQSCRLRPRIARQTRLVTTGVLPDVTEAAATGVVSQVGMAAIPAVRGLQGEGWEGGKV